MQYSLRTQRKGQSLIEIVVAMGMVVFFGAAFVTLVSTNYGRLESSRDQSRATLLAQEAINVVRTVAGKDFANDLKPNDSATPFYGIDSDAGTIKIDAPDFSYSGDSNPAVFERRVKIEYLYRDENGSPTPNNLPDPDCMTCTDESARFVTVSVIWHNDYKNGTIQMFTIVSDWSKGGSLVFDTLEDFNKTDSRYHTAGAVEEVFNGEVRGMQIGGLESPAIVPTTIVRGSTEDDQAILEGDASDHKDMILSGEELFVLSDTKLSVYDVSNISGDTPSLTLRNPGETDQTFTLAQAMAISDSHVFVGTANPGGEILVFDRGALGSPTSWNLPGDGGVIALSYDEQTDHLLVSRTISGPNDKNFYALDVSQSIPSDVTTIISFEQRIGTEALNHITSDGRFAYLGTGGGRVLTICLWSGCGYEAKTIVSFNPSNVPIASLAYMKGILYVGREANASEPELMAFNVIWDLQQRSANVSPLGTAELGMAVNAVVTDADFNRVIALTDRTAAAQNDVAVFTANLQSVSAFKTIGAGGTTCVSAGYEPGRLFLACSLGGQSKLFVAEDTVAREAWAPYASYTTPPTCVDGLTKWSLLSFKESGEGYVDVQLRVADSEELLAVAPWQGGFDGSLSPNAAFTDETLWHNISGLTKPCIQARVRFHATAFCPLYLETLILTYESE